MKPVIMGILNCTPDSFYEGSRKQSDAEITGRVEEILTQGGAIVDVGAYSTRPGAQHVTQEEETERMRHALKIIREVDKDVTLSIDSFRPEVARMAVEEYGAQIINDVSGGQYGMFEEVARQVALRQGPAQVRYVLMSVQKDVDSIIHFFHRDLEKLHSLGVRNIILDPGFGFGKSTIHGNYSVLQSMHRIKDEFPDLPLLAGVSRKRMIWQVLGCSPDDIEAKQGTMILNIMALERGAEILRVHDVRSAAETIRLFEALKVKSEK